MARRRRFSSSIWLGPLVIVAFALLIVLLPAILPWLAVQDAIDRRRRVRAATSFRCTRCSHPIGQDGLDLGAAVWGRTLQRDRPGLRLRHVRHLWALCARCGCQFGYDDKLGQFHALGSDYQVSLPDGP